MCGIVGIWNFGNQKLEQVTLNYLTDSLVHRGPDGRGIFLDEVANLGLGHRRLAILDTSNLGHQPMSYGGQRYWISYNGEIYNFIELRKELEKCGHHFKTNTDTEVVLAAYVQWGQDCQFKFNGMWAFAVWDKVEQTLFLSRDRFGVKPLFFLSDNEQFIFASELKAFMALPVKARPDFDLAMVARMKNEESIEKTLLDGVRNLNGGCCLSIKHGGIPSIRKWWTTSDHLEDVPRKFEDQVDRYREVFFDACRIRMRSDVPIGTALSGGLDSSSVLCAMSEIRRGSLDEQRLARDWQKAFVLVYSDTSHDESVYAKEVVKHTGAVPIYKAINPNAISIDDLDSAIWGFEAIQSAEPSIGPWLIYQEMRRCSIPVSMDGLGGDETLGGYHEYLPIAMKDSIWPIPNAARWHDLKTILSGLYEGEISEGSDAYIPNLGSILISLIPAISDGKESLVNLLGTSPWLLDQVRKVYRRIRNQDLQSRESERTRWIQIEPAHPTLRHRDTGRRGWGFLQKYLYNDFHYGTNARSLRNFDRMSMAHGIESRAPFMDWRLVCLSFSLPPESKIAAGFTKRILREAMRDVLPETIRMRKSKLGFSSPMPIWYQYSLRSYVLDTLNSRRFIESDIWNGPAIRDFTEVCYNKRDYVGAVKCWKYIQAYVLMNSFQKTVGAS